MFIRLFVAVAFGLLGGSAIAGEREQEIMTTCAAASGGNPKAMAVCGAAALTKQEIDNFFHGEAFGPNNEFVKILRNLFPGKKEFVNSLVTVVPYNGGVIYGFKSGVYFSPDGENARGGGNTVRIYPPIGATAQTAAVIAMVPWKNGVITAFDNAGVYYSPDGQNVGGGGSTVSVYEGSQTARAMAIYTHSSGRQGVKTLFGSTWYCSPDGQNVGGGGSTTHC